MSRDLETVREMLIHAVLGQIDRSDWPVQACLDLDEAITSDNLALAVMEFFAGREADLISELRSERDDLADELDNVRSAFRDRWAAFGSKGGE